MAKRYFCLSDVHSFYKQMMEALEAEGFDICNKEHYVILCGDMFDRGPKPKETLDFFQALGDRFIYVRGNHEDLLENCVSQMIKGQIPSGHHFSNKTVDTVLKLCGITLERYWRLLGEEYSDSATKVFSSIRKKMLPILDWIKEKAVDYYETDKHIFVHGWIPCRCDDERAYIKTYTYQPDWRENGNWDGARWVHGAVAWSDEVKEEGKTIVCGHWHTSWAHANIHGVGSEFKDDACFLPFIDDGIVALDACTAYSGFCNCHAIEEKDI